MTAAVRFGAAGMLAAALLLCTTGARAGRSCETKKPTAQAIAQGLELAERTMRALDETQADVVVLARAGQDLRKYGLHYSHLGFAYKTADGWRVLHKLNSCGTATSGIYRQGLGEFFMDDLWRMEAAYAVPMPAVQERLLAMLRSDRRSVQLHHAPYSVVSYAWATRYQQSNQWAIETMALALDPAADTRARAQAWLRLRGYEPSTLRLGPLTRLGARTGSANVAFDDHPDDKRFTDRIETVTVDSVFRWLARAGLAASPVAVVMR